MLKIWKNACSFVTDAVWTRFGYLSTKPSMKPPTLKVSVVLKCPYYRCGRQIRLFKRSIIHSCLNIIIHCLHVCYEGQDEDHHHQQQTFPEWSTWCTRENWTIGTRSLGSELDVLCTRDIEIKECWMYWLTSKLTLLIYQTVGLLP